MLYNNRGLVLKNSKKNEKDCDYIYDLNVQNTTFEN